MRVLDTFMSHAFFTSHNFDLFDVPVCASLQYMCDVYVYCLLHSEYIIIYYPDFVVELVHRPQDIR